LQSRCNKNTSPASPHARRGKTHYHYHTHTRKRLALAALPSARPSLKPATQNPPLKPLVILLPFFYSGISLRLTTSLRVRLGRRSSLMSVCAR
jgi:hypothetical protein